MGSEIVRAILIDPFKCSVTLVEHDSRDLWNVYRTLSHETVQVSIFDVVYPDIPFLDGDAIFYDSEASSRPLRRAFRVSGYSQPIAGKGLVLGTNMRGEMDDCITDLVTVRKATRFFERVDELGLVDTLTPWTPHHEAPLVP